MRFVCVHGVGHGPWAFEPPRVALEAMGHRVEAPELPLTSLEDDAAAVEAVLDTSTEPTVLVGHSYGGLVISRAAANPRNIAHLVYIAAIMIDANETIIEVGANHPTSLDQHLQFSEDGTFTVDPDGARQVFYGRCRPEDADAAIAQLRPTAAACLMSPPMGTPWRAVPSTYVVCADDKAVAPDLQRKMANRASRVIEIDTDHSPFLSATEELVDILTAPPIAPTGT